MRALRSLSARPELVVDPNSVVSEPLTALTAIGVAGPLGRHRLVTALPTNKSQPVQLKPPELIAGIDQCLLGDPDGNVFGTPGLWCHRMLYAERVRNTRRL